MKWIAQPYHDPFYPAGTVRLLVAYGDGNGPTGLYAIDPDGGNAFVADSLLPSLRLPASAGGTQAMLRASGATRGGLPVFSGGGWTLSPFTAGTAILHTGSFPVFSPEWAAGDDWEDVDSDSGAVCYIADWGAASAGTIGAWALVGNTVGLSAVGNAAPFGYSAEATWVWPRLAKDSGDWSGDSMGGRYGTPLDGGLSGVSSVDIGCPSYSIRTEGRPGTSRATMSPDGQRCGEAFRVAGGWHIVKPGYPEGVMLSTGQDLAIPTPGALNYIDFEPLVPQGYPADGPVPPAEHWTFDGLRIGDGEEVRHIADAARWA